MKDLLRISELTAEDLHLLLDVAAEAKSRPDRWSNRLAGETVVLYFAKPSTRTRLSLETAVARLGAVPAVVGPGELQLGRARPSRTPPRSSAGTPGPSGSAPTPATTSGGSRRQPPFPSSTP